MYHIEARSDGTAVVRQDGLDISDQVSAVTIRLEAGKRPIVTLETVTVAGAVQFTGPADEEDV